MIVHAFGGMKTVDLTAASSRAQGLSALSSAYRSSALQPSGCCFMEAKVCRHGLEAKLLQTILDMVPGT